MRTWGFAWVNSAGQENHLFVLKAQALVAIGEHVWIRRFFMLFLNPVLGADRYDLHFPAFKTVYHRFSVKIYVRLIEQFQLQHVRLLNRLLVAEGEGKGKVGDLVLGVSKVVLKLKEKHLRFSLLIQLKPKRGLLNDSAPLLLLVG